MFKTAGLTLVGGFLLLVSLSKSDIKYPKVKEISFEDSKSFEEIMQETELYQKTLGVEDTIAQTSQIIKTLKNENTKRPSEITKW